MKLSVYIIAAASLLLAPTSVVHAQTSPTPSPSASSNARTDVYHVYFGKAAAGKGAQMAEMLKAPDPQAPMPGHVLILRHQSGDAWDYAAIEHLGTKATVDSAPFQTTANFRDVTEWHNDTYVNGPPWAEFAKEMGIGDDASKTAGSVYVVTVYRAVPGQRDGLEKFLSQPPDRAVDTSSGNVLMQHLEGAPWNFVQITRYNSWQDFGKNEMNTVQAALRSDTAGWFQMRQLAAYHTDTATYRISP